MSGVVSIVAADVASHLALDPALSTCWRMKNRWAARMIVDADHLTRFIHREIDNYEYVVPAGAVGKPWPQEKVDQQLAQLRACLIVPYKLTFERRDTIEQIERQTPLRSDYWVVADDGNGFLVFYDPSTADFGLAQQGFSDKPVTIGVRGDVVGVFMSR